jgi:hypothetical protein
MSAALAEIAPKTGAPYRIYRNGPAVYLVRKSQTNQQHTIPFTDMNALAAVCNELIDASEHVQ